MNHPRTAVFATVFVLGAGLPAAAQQSVVPADAPDRLPRFESADRNGDGAISRDEFDAAFPEMDDRDRMFSTLDADDSGTIGRQQWAEWQEQRAAAGAAAAEAEAEPETDVSEEWSAVPTRSVEIEGTRETLQLRYLTDAGMVGLEGNELALGFLISTDRDFIGSGRVLVPGLLDQILPQNITLRFGGKAMLSLLADPTEEVFSIGPGVEARIGLPFLEDIPVAAVGEMYYVPDILTFGDADSVFELSGRVEVGFLENTTGFAGFRLLRFDREGGGDKEVVENIMVGLRFAL